MMSARGLDGRDPRSSRATAQLLRWRRLLRDRWARSSRDDGPWAGAMRASPVADRSARRHRLVATSLRTAAFLKRPCAVGSGRSLSELDQSLAHANGRLIPRDVGVVLIQPAGAAVPAHTPPAVLHAVAAPAPASLMKGRFRSANSGWQLVVARWSRRTGASTSRPETSRMPADDLLVNVRPNTGNNPLYGATFRSRTADRCGPE